MVDYIKLEAVLNRIPIAIREQESEGNLLSYALDIYKEINVAHKYETNIVLLQLKDHKVKLPDDVKHINILTYQSNLPTPGECCELLRCADEVTCNLCQTTCPDINFSGDNGYCCSCGECLTEPENYINRSNLICRHTLSYQLFLSSQYYANNFEPLKYVGTGSNICTKCTNRFQVYENWFKVSPTRVLWSNLKDVILCMDYDAEVTIDGNIMIPNHSKLIRAMAAYAEAIHWKNKISMHEENAINIYQQRLAEAEVLLKSARGDLLLQSVDVDKAEDLSIGQPNFQLTKVPEFYYA